MIKNIVVFTLVLLWPVSAFPFDKFFAEPCAKAGIPKELAIAIARQESSLHPWCINIQGKDYVPKTYQEACNIIQKAHKAGKSYDVGLMQINCEWTKRWKMNPLDLLDPATNVRLGIEILKAEIQRHGMSWKAVGKYHSPKIERGRKYAWKVFNRMKGGNYGKTFIAARETPKRNINSVPYRDGIFRSRGIEPKGRLITFRVCEEGLPGQSDTEQGGSAGKEGAAKN